MLVRKTTYDDLKRLEEVFACARDYMRENGNPTQWGNNRPDMSLIIKDIENGNSYVMEEDSKVVATFACIPGIEPTYIDIDGKWLNDDEYVTIHRIASDGSVKGVFDEAIRYCEKFNVDIRIDTHRNNKTMIHLIERSGFTFCGIIIVDDNTERQAYQRICRKY
ncbi:MAG: N-acetyltransferase [Erysipelotrichaceae bacterium]|nr:N-acetyltransferase [Erysipelotrichaceae bacterium]